MLVLSAVHIRAWAVARLAILSRRPGAPVHGTAQPQSKDGLAHKPNSEFQARRTLTR